MPLLLSYYPQFMHGVKNTCRSLRRSGRKDTGTAKPDSKGRPVGSASSSYDLLFSLLSTPQHPTNRLSFPSLDTHTAPEMARSDLESSNDLV